MNVTYRRNMVQYQIDQDPWTIVVRRSGSTPDAAHVTFSFTGTIKPAGMAGGLARVGTFTSEPGVANYTNVLLAPYDTPALVKEDVLVGTNTTGSFTREFIVISPRQLAWKWECILDERV
jgi:hypothetical protein